MVIRIFVDFHNCDTQGRVRLNTVGTFADLAAKKFQLEEGTAITLYCDELEADGVLELSEQESIWVAKFRNLRTRW